MKHEEDTLLSIRDNAWTQGSLFLASSNDLGTGTSSKKNLYLLVTHSCDIVHSSFKEEPFAEAILANKIETNDNQFVYGKNPRKIHVEIYKDKTTEWFELSTANRVLFDRKKLTEFKPLENYRAERVVLENVISWLSKKYDRATFPDEFNKRLAEYKIKDKIVRLLKKNGRNILGLFVRLNSYAELDDKYPYKMSIYMLLDEDAENDNNQFDSAMEQIVTLLQNNQKIQVALSRVVTKEEMTVKDFLTMQHWDFDYLSHRQKPGGKTVKKR